MTAACLREMLPSLMGRSEVLLPRPMMNWSFSTAMRCWLKRRYSVGPLPEDSTFGSIFGTGAVLGGGGGGRVKVGGGGGRLWLDAGSGRFDAGAMPLMELPAGTW